MSDEHESEAMKRVIDSMGAAARAAKVKKYTRKTMPVQPPAKEEESAETDMPSEEECAAMMGE